MHSGMATQRESSESFVSTLKSSESFVSCLTSTSESLASHLTTGSSPFWHCLPACDSFFFFSLRTFAWRFL